MNTSSCKSENYPKVEWHEVPFEINDLMALFMSLTTDCCDAEHTLNQTRKFLKHTGIDEGIGISWLKQRGGDCDCNVIYKVYFNMGRELGWCITHKKGHF